MAVNSLRTTTITFTGDVSGTESFATSNSASPGQMQVMNLSSGANTVTVPTGGTVPTAVTIIPPDANTVLLTLKGVSGDTGVKLHLTDTTTVAVDSTVTTFVITAAGTVTGLRLVWS